MSEIHYEIFRQQGRNSGWSLVEAFPDRETALERARSLLGEGHAAAVRVVKETYNSETGDYMSLTVFEDGKAEIKKKNRKTEEINSPVPCFKPDDLYSYHARMTIARLVGEWLARQRLTVTELIHSASALEKFEATGTTYQHAIQKIAVSQASESEFPVTQIVKQLNELTTAAIHRVYKDDKRGLFPIVAAGKFGQLAEKLSTKPDAAYLLNGALAKYLGGAKTWDMKLRLMLALMGEIAEDGPARALLLTAIDSLIAEMLQGSAALADLLGQNPDLGHALTLLVELFLGSEISLSEDTGGSGINELALFFAKDDLPEARAAIAGRILSELRGMKRLCPSSLDDELKMLRQLANRLVRGQGKYLSHDDLIGAFTERSKRLVAHEPLLQFMEGAKTADQKLERLLTVEENIVGVENKRALSNFVMPLIASNGFEAQLLPAAPVTQRLKRLSEIQARVLRSGFQETQKNAIAAAIDGVAVRLEERAKFLASLETRMSNSVERAQTLIKLMHAGIFTQGEVTAKAKRLLLASLAKPGFMAAYVAQREIPGAEPVVKEKVLTELARELEPLGIALADTLRTVAA